MVERESGHSGDLLRNRIYFSWPFDKNLLDEFTAATADGSSTPAYKMQWRKHIRFGQTSTVSDTHCNVGEICIGIVLGVSMLSRSQLGQELRQGPALPAPSQKFRESKANTAVQAEQCRN